jgi:hypothetical protein
VGDTLAKPVQFGFRQPAEEWRDEKGISPEVNIRELVDLDCEMRPVPAAGHRQSAILPIRPLGNRERARSLLANRRAQEGGQAMRRFDWRRQGPEECQGVAHAAARAVFHRVLEAAIPIGGPAARSTAPMRLKATGVATKED